MQYTIMLKPFQEFSVEQWTLHTLSKCHVGDVADTQ